MTLMEMAHQMTHWAVDKLVSQNNTRGYISRAAQEARLVCTVCLKYNPGKTIHTAPGHSDLPKGPSKVWQMDIIQLPFLAGTYS